MLLIMSSGSGIIVGQLPDSSSRKAIIEQQLQMLGSVHDSVFGNNKELIDGRVYYSGGNKFVHPFYADNTWKPATIISNGSVYVSELVKYDICLDYLIMLYRTDSLSYPVCLNRESVKEFTIYDRRFQYIDEVPLTTGDPDPGYYEVVHDGKTKFMVRRIKLKTFDSSSLTEIYSDRINYYLYKDGRYIKLTRLNKLPRILDDHRKEIREFMKAVSIRLSEDNYDMAGRVLDYYETL